MKQQFIDLSPITYEQEQKRKVLVRLFKGFAALLIILTIYFHQELVSFLLSLHGCIILAGIIILLIYAHIEPFFPKFAYRTIYLEKKIRSIAHSTSH